MNILRPGYGAPNVAAMASGVLQESYLSSDTLTWITHARSGTATYFNSSGVLSTAADGDERMDYDPATLDKRGLLIETASQNYLFPSNGSFDSSYTKYNSGADPVVVTDANTTSPLGTTTASKFDLPAVSSSNVTKIYKSIDSWPASTRLTASVWVKGASGGEKVALIGFNGTSYFVNIITATTSWVRYSVTTDPSPGVPSTVYFQFGYDGSAHTTFTQSACSVYIFGAQVEEGTTMSSYIPTTSAAVSRNADSVDDALYSSDSVTMYYRNVSDLSQSSKTLNPFSNVASETGIWIERFTKP